VAPLIRTDGLVKNFGPVEAVRGISFQVERGEVLGFLGPNGAGKSTTMKMIAGFLAPTSGRAEICGFDVAVHPLDARRRLGYLPEGAPAYGDMTVAGFLRFAAEVRGFRCAEATSRVERSVNLLELSEVLLQPIDTLSKGFKRRVGLAQALLHDPEVLILDEPTDGLDPNQKFQVRNLIQAMAAEKAIIISTHILEEVDAVCTRAMVIARGRILADGTPQELEARSRFHNAVYLRTEQPMPQQALDALKALPEAAGIEAATRAGDTGIYVLPQPGAPLLAAVQRTILSRSVTVEELRVERGQLDGVFRDLTIEHGPARDPELVAP
jgi:ABC-2 type transport system ATP-binding protein